MMAYLVLRRFVIRKMENNFKNNRKVYFFDDTAAVRNAMKDFNNDSEFHSVVERIEGAFYDSTGYRCSNSTG